MLHVALRWGRDPLWRGERQVAMMEKAKILVVDDEPTILDYLKEFLEGKGYVVTPGIPHLTMHEACKG